jgi:hypothetical protein
MGYAGTALALVRVRREQRRRRPPMKKMFKVLSPITKKDGSTFWMRVGTGFPNKDDSVNVYLDVFPKDGKLQLREMDERDLRPSGKSPAVDNEALPF